MKVYQSQEILNLKDLYDLQDTFCSSCVPFQYQMTDGELQWFQHIKNRYCISDFISANLDNNNILTFDCAENLTAAIENDGIPNKAVMLSEETALQKLFFWLS